MCQAGVSLPPPLVLEEEEEDFQQAFSTLCSAGEGNSSLAKQRGILWSLPVAGHRDLPLDLNRLPRKQWANAALFLLHWGGEAAINQRGRV